MATLDTSCWDHLRDKGWASVAGAGSPDSLGALASQLGHVVHQPSRPTLSVLRPIDASVAPPLTASATYGLGRFPYHTDLAHWPRPPRYLVMGNGRTASAVPTLLLDTAGGSLLIGLEERARRALWSVSKSRRPFVATLFITNHRHSGLRWDTNVMGPLNDHARYVTAELQARLEGTHPAHEVAHAWTDEDRALILDNWRMLHARPAVPSADTNRLLYRLYVMED